MAANTSPIFTLTPNLGAVALSVANTGRDGTGTLGTVLTAGANGTRLEMVRVVATGTTTAGMVRLFYDSGAAKFLLAEIAVTAITPSATVQAFSAELVFTRPIVLPTGSFLKASTEKAETFSVFCYGGDY